MAKTKISFSSILAVFTSFLGVKSLDEDEKGKIVLTKEQRESLVEQFGEDLIRKFEKELSEQEAAGTLPDNATVQAIRGNYDNLKTQFDQAISSNHKLEAEKQQLQNTIDKLVFFPEADLPEKIDLSAGGKAGKKVAFRPDMNMLHNRVIENFYNGDRSMMYSTDTTIDTSELQTEFGKYITHEKIEILKRLTADLTCTDFMTTIVTDLTEWKASQAIISSVLQQFTPFWTPKGTAEFTPITIKNFFLKANVVIKPADIIDQYIGYLYDETLTPDQMPIVKYIVDALILPKLMEDLEEAMAVGKFVEVTPTKDGEDGSASTASMDGYVTILKSLKTAGTAIGAWLLDGVTLTADNILEQVDLAVAAVSKNYRKKKLLVYADPDVILMYNKAYLAKYPYTKNEDEGKTKIDFTNFSWQPVEGMLGTGVFFITPKENWKHLMSKNPAQAKIYMQVQNYDVKVFIEFRKGTGFAMLEAIFAYIPPTDSTSGSASGGL